MKQYYLNIVNSQGKRNDKVEAFSSYNEMLNRFLAIKQNFKINNGFKILLDTPLRFYVQPITSCIWIKYYITNE